MNETRNPILSPNQKRWLVNFLIGVGGIFLGRWGIPLPAEPFPLEVRQQVAETNTAVKKIEANNLLILQAAGIQPK